MTIGTLVVNGYDCIANKVTDANKYAAKCDSVSATKNENGSYTVTIINVKDNIETNIIAHQVVVGELTVPESKTPQEIQTKLEARLTGRKDGTAFYDITLKTYDSVKEEWVEVTDDNFPPNGVDVKLGYPQNTDSKDTFQIVHMLTKSGREGEIEKITPENKSDGLHFHVDSLSPFGVSWVKYVAPTPGGGGGGGGGGAVSTCTLTFDTNGREGEYFALRVRGESMLNAGILPGDLVVVHQQPVAHNGEIVVALLGDEATVKRLSRRNGEVWLLPENEAYSPIDGREASILGKVTAVVRQY